MRIGQNYSKEKNEMENAKRQEMINVARDFIRKDTYSFQKIAEKTGLSLDEIRSLSIQVYDEMEEERKNYWVFPTLEPREITYEDLQMIVPNEGKMELWDGTLFGDYDELCRFAMLCLSNVGLQAIIDRLPAETLQELKVAIESRQK